MRKKENSLPTIADIARRANVSPMTVSRTMRQPEAVSEKARVKVQAAIKELGYIPNPAARNLAAGRSDVIGVIVPSITNNVFADVMDGIYDVIENTQYQVQFANARYSPEKEEGLIRTFLGQKPSGLIISGIDQTDAARKMLQNASCRVVQIMEIDDNPIDMMVGFSHFDAAKAATLHLLEMGYKKPGFIAARLDPRAIRRIDGFKAVVAKIGLLDERRIVTTSDRSSITIGRKSMEKLLAQAPDTDAIICNNDDLAMGALFECQKRGISVPNTVGICGFNDLEMVSATHPTLTSVQTFRRKIGLKATQMLMHEPTGQAPSQKVIDTGFKLMPRESTNRARN